MRWWVDFLSRLYGVPPDPARHCQFHREMRCCPLDGPGCDVRTCEILKDYREFLRDE